MLVGESAVSHFGVTAGSSGGLAFELYSTCYVVM